MSRKIIFFLAFALSFSFSAKVAANNPAQNRLSVVVLDPGHGGRDSGAVSNDKKTYEKNIVLDIAKRIKTYITNEYGDSVKVLLTRTTDVFIPLQERADFANKNDANLFLSIHINANSRTTPSGHSAHILGASSDPGRDLNAGNFDVCKRENSVLMLEDDFSVKEQGFDPDDESSYIFMTLIQSAFYEQSIYFASIVEDELTKGPIKVRRGVEQNPFYVLWKTAMPSVLLELGFITNSEDLCLLRTESGRDKIAGRVFEAFRKYKKIYDESMSLDIR